LGDVGGMLFGANLAQGLNPVTAAHQSGSEPEGAEASQTRANAVPAMSVDQQIEAVKKLKELLDAGILTQQEFDTKKQQILGL
jgi:hypothetical protein